jgi:uncharacterized repeat protein (TIGR03803 family)
MKVSELGRYALCVSIAAAMLAGCGGSQPLARAPGALPQTSTRVTARTATLRSLASSSYQVLYRFGHHANPLRNLGGAYPEGVLDLSGTLYGTTYGGGNEGFGTVYSMSASGAKKVLHRFGTGPSSSNDGLLPVGDLIEVNGLLYGATVIGGKCGSGSVYSISTSGTETILHSFCYPDGIQPIAGLVNVNGTLYGTTEYGASANYAGTVYSVTTAGKFKTLHTFKNSPDGSEPGSPLINVKGTLYGTTAYGGSGCKCGTFYRISTTGKEKVLYSFQGGSDGSLPFGSLIDVNGTLYGTTNRGGGNQVGCQPSYAGCGTIYSISTTGKEKVLWAFNSTNGTNPTAGLLEMNGSLYGTTTSGGSNGWGVVFSLSLSGGQHVLHNFAGGSDGANPSRELIDVNGTLYGATSYGGSTSTCKVSNGCGTVFALTP